MNQTVREISCTNRMGKVFPSDSLPYPAAESSAFEDHPEIASYNLFLSREYRDLPYRIYQLIKDSHKISRVWMEESDPYLRELNPTMQILYVMPWNGLSNLKFNLSMQLLKK